jgi:pilus assembly protein CpaD
MLALKVTPRLRAALTILASLLVSTSLSGCFNAGPRFQAPLTLANPNERHPIQIEPSERTLDLDIYGGRGLSPSQRAELRIYLRAYAKNGSRLMVRAPSGGNDDKGSLRAFEDMRLTLRQAGIDSETVVLETYYVKPGQPAPLRLSYLQYVAKAPDCPDWSENVGRDPQNEPWPNMGCATQRNLAVAVADPRDLIGPRAQTPRSSERRDIVWDKYLKGDTVTGAVWGPGQTPLSEHATASDVGKVGGQ